MSETYPAAPLHENLLWHGPFCDSCRNWCSCVLNTGLAHTARKDVYQRTILPKPQWEFPRLCRGGSKSLTYPAVDTVGLSTKLRIVSSQAHEEEFHRWMTMKA
jgi:hypothetical protein